MCKILRSTVFFLLLLFLSSLAVQGQAQKQKANDQIAQIMEKYGKAVVLIATMDSDEGTIGQGSGFIIRPTGVILTNFHVIEGAYPAIIKLKNGDVYEDISVIDTDSRRDIAIIKIKGWNLPTVKLGNSNKTKVGQRVVVIGNPHGLENTISDGLLSGMRDFGLGYKVHQISAPISSGSSGSPVFNLNGEVIGIATATIHEGQNLNFSLPINYARGMITETPKMTLAEFAKTKSIPPIYQSIESKKKKLELGDFLVQLNEITCRYFAASDAFEWGGVKTAERIAERIAESKGWIVDQEIYRAQEMLIDLQDDFSKIKCEDERAIELIDGYSRALSNANDGVELVLTGGTYPTNMNKANKVSEGSAKLQSAISILFSLKDTFIALVDENVPELKEKMLPVYRAQLLNKCDPFVGFHYAFGVMDKIIIIYIITNSPAAGKLKSGDVIVGVQNGPELRTIVEYAEYIKTKRPGRKVVFRVTRSGKEYMIEIELGSRY